ncbi:iron-containing alcohol dehydrogenase [Erwinia sp. 9145]|uniref:iron-containing alcohol dehydrogenase family protein n=1 Tax=Erwinia sp. 9145 TaxID=1500895 RepID=UPI000554DEB5|nr:iron-containing alcohol dehydrogenase [Erwinia sp. 9145]
MFEKSISHEAKNFAFSLPVRIIFEVFGLNNLSAYLRDAGKSDALIVLSESAKERFSSLINHNENSSDPVRFTYWTVENNFKASTKALHAIQSHLRTNNYDAIVSIGGGNIIDFVKVAAISLSSAIDIDTVVGKTFDKVDKKILHVAVPTTFGTGSEVTKGAIIYDSKRHIKEGVRGDAIFPDIALVDPQLGASLPDAVLRETLFDSFTHVFEALHAVKSNPLTETLAVASLKRLNGNIARYSAGQLDADFYSEAALISLAGGICVCHNSTCLPHRFEQAFAPFYQLSHGAGLAAIYPAWVRALEREKKISPLLAQFSEGKSASDYVANILRELKLDDARERLATAELSATDMVKRVTGNVSNDPLIDADSKVIPALLSEIIRGEACTTL